MTFDPEELGSGSLSRYLNDETEDRRDRAGSLARYLDTDNPDNDRE